MADDKSETTKAVEQINEKVVDYNKNPTPEKLLEILETIFSED